MKMRKLLAALVASALAVSAIAISVSADNTDTDSIGKTFTAFPIIGADITADDWGYAYWGKDATNNAGDVTAVEAEIADGGTATVSITLPAATINCWVTNPCLIIDTAAYPDAVFTCTEVKVDGTAVALDATAGDTCWAEETGAVAKESCLRAAGYNEWGGKYIAEPANFTTIEFTVTLDLYGDGLDVLPAADTAVGDTDTATDGSSKDAVDTGVEGVAAIAGLALVATGAIIVAKKRK